ncbi:MAG: hypothetical protein ACF8AM_22705, partial [Rhodopirellula sp. JB055]|uniref:hypothetical protein n=1 Tax=Rhodopirellula sp. JB055 TaxID=3342846 RepID=UPI00370C5D54
MQTEPVNPYASPVGSAVDRGRGRFRLRRWFAFALFVGLGYDYYRLAFFGFQPFVASLWIFFLAILFSVVTR